MSIAFFFFKPKINLESYIKQIGNSLWQNLQHLFFTASLITSLSKENQPGSKQLSDLLKPNATEEEIVQHLFKMYENLTK